MQALTASARESTPPSRKSAIAAMPSWSSMMGRAARCKPLEYLTTVHLCFINGVRTLVHRRGLQAESLELFAKLAAYAERHGFVLREGRRKRELTCRDERRRMAPILLFAAGLLSHGLRAEEGGLRDRDVTVVPTIDVIGQRPTTDRAYLIEAGKRFVSKLHGTVELILGVAAEVRHKGEKHRVRTRSIQMPSEYTDTFVDRYDYTIPTSCGEETFSYYEGEASRRWAITPGAAR